MTRLSKLWARIVVTAIGAVDTFLISKIKNPTIQAAMRMNIAPLKATATVLSDENPRDDEQIEQIWRNHVGTNVASFTETELGKAIAKIQDPNLQVVLLTLSFPIVNVLRIVSDDDVHDGEQLERELKAFINSDESQRVLIENVLVPFLTKRISDEGVRDLILTILRELLDGGEI